MGIEARGGLLEEERADRRGTAGKARIFVSGGEGRGFVEGRGGKREVGAEAWMGEFLVVASMCKWLSGTFCLGQSTCFGS